MLTLTHLETLEEIMEEGRHMNNALEVKWFAQIMIDQGVTVSVVKLNGEHVANLAIEDYTVTNVVGPGNAPVSAELLLDIDILLMLHSINLPEGLTHLGPRSCG